MINSRQHGHIYSSLASELRLVTLPSSVVSVEVVGGQLTGSLVPAQRDIVTVKVLAVNPRFAKVN